MLIVERVELVWKEKKWGAGANVSCNHLLIPSLLEEQYLSHIIFHFVTHMMPVLELYFLFNGQVQKILIPLT